MPRGIPKKKKAAVFTIAAATESPLSQTQREIVEACDAIKELLLRKNAAYGDSALKPVRLFSKTDNVEQIKVRLDDKLSRLMRGHALPDETLEQTTEDLIGYLVLLQIAIKRRRLIPGTRL